MAFGELLAIEVYGNQKRWWRLGMLMGEATLQEKESIGIRHKEALYKVEWYRQTPEDLVYATNDNHTCFYYYETVIRLREKFQSLMKTEKI